MNQQPLSNKKLLFILGGILVILLAFTGGFLFGKSSLFKPKFLPQVAQISPTPVVPTPTPVITANWKSYRNGNVIFKFPSQWIEKPILIRGSGFTQEFEDPENKFSLTFLGNGNYNQVTGKPYVNLEDYINFRYKEKVKKPITIDGQEGAEIFPRAGSENINSVEFFSKDSKFIYTLELKSGNTALDTSRAEVEEGQRLFNLILSTFKFLE